MGIFLRWLFAFLLLAATYNPTQWSYARWSYANYETYLSLVVFMGFGDWLHHLLARHVTVDWRVRDGFNLSFGRGALVGAL